MSKFCTYGAPPGQLEADVEGELFFQKKRGERLEKEKVSVVFGTFFEVLSNCCFNDFNDLK